MLTVEEARRRILDGLALPGPDQLAARAERVAIAAAAGRYPAAPHRARWPFPLWDNSAMDGFAVRAAELPATLPIAGTIAAGDPPDRELAPGTTLRIMTGAPLPAGADAVVIREVVDDRGDSALFERAAEIGQNIRRAGEDIAADAPLVELGVALGAGEIGILAAQGHAEVEVLRRPRVGLLSTGDELVDVDAEPKPGQIINSNAYALAVQVAEAGGEPVHLGIAGDDRETLTAAIADAVRGVDVLVTSGGVSVGDFDFVKEAFADAGVAMDFWKVAMKPGKPLAFGRTEAGVPVFGLPGNPVSSMVVFELFARPALLAMAGARDTMRPRAPVILSHDYRKQPGRAHFVRATLERRAGELHATALTRQGSGMLTSMAGIDALVEVPADSAGGAAGDRLEALLLRAR